MLFSNKQWELIEESDLQALVDNEISESKIIEYKEILPENSNSKRKEFLADVSSFANASGGYLIYGIKEESGIPVEVCGLADVNSDGEILRLESMIRDGLEPRITPSISIRAIPLETSNVVIIIHIPRSWALPHMIKFKLKDHERFFSRNSAGKYPLDLSDIRATISLSETAVERIKYFRTERLSKIVAEETPVPLNDIPKIILHIVPLGAFDIGVKFDISQCGHGGQYSIQPMIGSSWDHRYNFDGILVYTPVHQRSNSHSTYSQIFFNGNIEVVDASILEERNGQRVLHYSYENILIKTVSKYLSIQKQIGVEPPLFIMLSLLGVSGYKIEAHSDRFWEHNVMEPIDRDALLIPEVMIETFGCDVTRIMKPIFDSVWNATGWPQSMNYNENGEWVGQ